MRRKRLPTATDVGTVEQEIVAAAMSFVAATERERKLQNEFIRLEKDAKYKAWKAASNLTVDFEEALKKRCRRLRKMLKEIASVKRKSK